MNLTPNDLLIEMTSTKNTICTDGICPTLTARMGTGGGQVNAVMSYSSFGDYHESEISSTLLRNDNGTLQAKESGGSSLNLNNVVRKQYTVRRLTPTECERLQGYPDGWTDIGEWVDTKGKKHKPADSPRYKALGNSIAIPPWLWVLSRLNEYCEEKTMASLFDGLGGFPLIWEFLNGKGSAVWCSEIEEFPIAVTKKRFPEKENKNDTI